MSKIKLLSESLREIPGFKRYYISDRGNIYSEKSGELKPIAKQIKKGYYYITLRKGRKVINLKVSRLVASTFKKNPHLYAEVNHENGNKLDDQVSNLSWVTPSQNVNHAYRIGLTKGAQGTNNRASKLTVGAVLIIRDSNASLKELSHRYGVGKTAISDIRNNKTWRHLL